MWEDRIEDSYPFMKRFVTISFAMVTSFIQSEIVLSWQLLFTSRVCFLKGDQTLMLKSRP